MSFEEFLLVCLVFFFVAGVLMFYLTKLDMEGDNEL